MRRLTAAAPIAFLAALALVAPAAAAEPPCELEPRTRCFGVESLDAALSTIQAGAHPDLTFSFVIKQDPESEANSRGLKNAYAETRNLRIELPPGLIGDPNVLGNPQQCTAEELLAWIEGGGCPNGSQVGIAEAYTYELGYFPEPVYMMQPPGGDVVARLGFIAGVFPIFIDARVRSEGDYGLTLELSEIPTAATLVKSETITWAVPADPSHDTERCTPLEVFGGCRVSEERPPGSRPLPFLTNPTRCGVPLEMRVAAASWAEPERFDAKSASFPEITQCNRLPYGPRLTIEPTSRRAGAPSGLDITAQVPVSDGVKVLEPSQTRYIEVALPEGVSLNPGAADGLEVCSAAQAHLGERVAAQCPDAAKLAAFEAEIGGLPRRMRGAVYLREPEAGNPYRIWLVADDLGAHVKLEGQLRVDRASGQIESLVLGTARSEGIPQAPLREAKLFFFPGERAPLVTPPTCGTHLTSYRFTPWSGTPPIESSTPMTISEGCDTGGFSPRIASAGPTNLTAGRHSPFLFTLTREDTEQNIQGLDITLPRGLAASFTGIPRCEGAAAQTGQCPPGSRVGKVIAAVGAGPSPLWVPQPGKRPTAVYLSGPYKGAPLSIVAVVPRQAGPFDFGDEVVRSAIYVDPVTAQATAKADPLPQIIEGIPIRYRTIHVVLDRKNFTLNPTSCAKKQTESTLRSPEGAVARPSFPFQAANCAKLRFGPKLSFRLKGGTHRGAHPGLRAVLKGRPGDANIAGASVALPRSEFLDQAHIRTVCTRVQFAAHECPRGAIYGHAVAKTPLFDFPLKGPVYLRSSNHPLPDLVVALRGPESLPIEIDLIGRVDSVRGGIRTTFDSVPDAPVSSFTLSMQGGKKGLFINSRDLCKGKAKRAIAEFRAHNGRRKNFRPAVRAKCGKKKRAKRSSHRRARLARASRAG